MFGPRRAARGFRAPHAIALLLLVSGTACTPASNHALGGAHLLGRVAVDCSEGRPGRWTGQAKWLVRWNPSRLDRGSKLLRSTPIPPREMKPRTRVRREIVHPIVAGWLADSSASLRVTVLVSFLERVRIPRFPSLDDSRPRTDKVNQLRLREAAARIAAIRRQRRSLYRAEESMLAALPRAQVVEKFWLAPVYALELPLSSLDSLVRRPTKVVAIEPAVGRDAPPECLGPTHPPNNNGYLNGDKDDPIEARRAIRSDPFRELPLSHGTISLLDSGVWRDHALLANASFGVLGDCLHGNPENCLALPGDTNFDPSDQCADDRGHGTPAAAILVGTDALGDRWRGGLDLTLDSYQVYAPGDCGGDCGLCLNRMAAVRAFQAATSNLTRVIVANVIALGEDQSAVAFAANGAYDTGAIVVAANGNRGPVGIVESPAAAPRVLGIGARHVTKLHETDPIQSSGGTEGGRLKPDVQAPNGTETARYLDNCPTENNRVLNFVGTSGATPYAGVAAAMLRDWMKGADPDLEPGHVYAGMILSGRLHGERVNGREGAGLIQLPADCCTWFGAEEVSVTNPVREITLDLSTAAADSFEVALWWPEHEIMYEPNDEPLQHNDIDLVLARSQGGSWVEQATSRQEWSVFERATAPVTGPPGSWKIRIEAVRFRPGGREDDSPPSPDTKQIVYWAAAARPAASAGP